MRPCKDVKLPSNISEDLSYLCGFIMGDGHLCWRKSRNEYHIVCTGNLKNEKEFYDEILIPLFKKIFDIDMRIKINMHDNTYNIIFYSKRIVEFFTSIGIPTGSKSDKVLIPPIFKSSKHLLIPFIRGFADAEFCLSIKKRYRTVPYYPVLMGVSKSSRMIEDISEFLENRGFSIYKDLNRTKYDKRFGYTKISTITLYGHNQLAKWMKEIGFRNTKILKNVEIWKIRNIENPRAKKALEVKW